ncbi:MAG: serine--tRNA ligase [Phycisphaerae bacterium]|nr:serine--tRNA ligase [Phycisphaerae bacterium]
MLDIRFIRENPDLIKKAATAKRIEVDVDQLLSVDNHWRSATTEVERLKADQNAASKSIAKLAGDEKKAAIARMGEIKNRVKELGENVAELEKQRDALLLLVPQPADPEVPEGPDDTGNVEVKRWGEPRKFDFQPLDHQALGESLGIIDVERGAKLAGSRSYFLVGDGARLEWAVLMFAFNLIRERGFTPMIVPLLVRDEAMVGTGYFPGGEEQAYRVEKDAVNLVGTAEVSLTAYHMGETLAEADLPRLTAALSPCFRREAGTYGKDTRGIYRIHQFNKVEQVVVCRNDVEESKRWHLKILENSEAVMQAMNLPYRVVNVCTGDLGRGQAAKFDIETWMPGRNGYGETHSASRFYEFQARRLNLRYRDAQGNVKFCHTLNNTVIASPRVLIPILENYQNADGTVTIPTALRPYMGGQERIEKRK